MNNKQPAWKQNHTLPNTEFYHRAWCGGSIHNLKNKIGGAFGITKREWTEMIETRNRKNKALRAKNKPKK
jgi:hypothetical protein